jgi:hypothetical protein
MQKDMRLNVEIKLHLEPSEPHIHKFLTFSKVKKQKYILKIRDRLVILLIKDLC